MLFTVLIYARSYSLIVSINGTYVEYITMGQPGVIKIERLIYQDGELYEKKLFKCNINEKGFYHQGYFPSGHMYRVEVINPSSMELLYGPLEFEIE